MGEQPARLGYFERRRIDRLARRLALRDEPSSSNAAPLTERHSFFAERDVVLAEYRATLLPQWAATKRLIEALEPQTATTSAVASAPPERLSTTVGMEKEQVRAHRLQARADALALQTAAAADQYRLAQLDRLDKARAELADLENQYAANVELEHRRALLRRSYFDDALRRYHAHHESLQLDPAEPAVPTPLLSLDSARSSLTGSTPSPAEGG